MSRPAVLLGLLVVLTFLKGWLAARLGLFGDEAFYWQCAQHLAWAYADHPFMTALLVRVGTAIAGDTLLGVRLLFVVAGGLLPLAVYWLARALTGERDARLAGLLTLLLPLGGTLGLLAVPDVPLLLIAVFASGAMARATRAPDHAPGWWLLTGVLAALGLATHYRFLLWGAAAFGYLVATTHGRAWLRRPMPWIAGLGGLVGLLPVWLFNAGLDYAPLRYQFADRHPWQLSAAAGLRHPLEQALVTTPLLYGLLLAGFVSLLRRALRGDDRAALLAWLGGLPVLVYALLAPWSDNRHFHLHWPLLGYLPLLVAVPGVVHWCKRKGRQVGRAWGLVLAWLPGLGMALGGLGVLAVWGYYLLLVGYPGGQTLLPGALAQQLEKPLTQSGHLGWPALGQAVRWQLQDLQAQQRPRPVALVSDDYYLAAQLDFAFQGEVPVLLAPGQRQRDHGRDLQYRLWGRDLAGVATDPVLGKGPFLAVIDERGHGIGIRRYRRVRRLCRVLRQPAMHARLNLYGGALRYGIYLAGGLASNGQGGDPPRLEGDEGLLPLAAKCPVPSLGNIASLGKGQAVSGAVDVTGWAFNNSGGVSEVTLWVDGHRVAAARYGLAQLGLARVPLLAGGIADPNFPNVGWRLTWDTRGLAPGRHRVELRVRAGNGRVDRLSRREVSVTSPAVQERNR